MIQNAGTGHILVIDDDPSILMAARMALRPHVESVETFASPEGIDDLLASRSVDAVLLDMNFSPGQHSGKAGLDWLDRLHRIDPTLSIVLMTAYGGVALAVEALKRGAVDFVLKPWHNEKLAATTGSAVALAQARRDAAQANLRHLEHSVRTGEMVGASSALQKAWRLMNRASPTDASILLLGESGTGKALAAREIHRLSRRAPGPFVAVDLDGLAESRFESDLFGQKQGATAGADSDRAGRFQAADGGTLFLDEIGNLPQHLQRKLLTAIETQQVLPVGASRPVPVDVRVIAASSRAPADLGRDEVLRQDLLMRLRTIEIEMPPLRRRRDDVAPLLDHFLGFYARKHGVQRRRVPPDLLRRLETYDWPGNVRELRFAAERATLLSGEDRLGTEDFPFLFGSTAMDETDFDLEAIEKRTISRAMTYFKGNVSLAAPALGLTRPALYRRLEKHGL